MFNENSVFSLVVEQKNMVPTSSNIFLNVLVLPTIINPQAIFFLRSVPPTCCIKRGKEGTMMRREPQL
jgi:hypothetical protein